jgi:malate dehydrogenase
VLPNLYGDIISDLTAGLVGGLGVAPGANIGTEAAVFEATHGSAPKYTGQNKVNPTAMILSGKLMLDHIGERDAAERLEAAVAAVIAEGKSVTYDLKPTRDDPSAVGTSGRDHRAAPLTSSHQTKGDNVNGRKKVTVVGAGNVGATCALEVARRDYADVVLVDIIPNFAAGKALDMNQMASVTGYEPTILGSERYDETKGSDVVVITAGKPRSPGMSRDDLVTTNESIVGSVTKEVARRSPKAVIVVVSNPLDAMCHVAHAVSGFPKERVVGMAGILDTARFSAFIAWETGSSVKDVQAMVLGGHGDQMVPVVSATTVGGVPLEQLTTKGKIAKMVERTRKGGGELVSLLGTSAWYAPGAAAAQMVDAICLDQKRVLPCTALLEGEYSVDGLYMGVPVRLGAGGVEEIVKLKLSADEKKMVRESAAAVREVVGVLTTTA